MSDMRVSKRYAELQAIFKSGGTSTLRDYLFGPADALISIDLLRTSAEQWAEQIKDSRHRATWDAVANAYRTAHDLLQQAMAGEETSS